MVDMGFGLYPSFFICIPTFWFLQSLFSPKMGQSDVLENGQCNLLINNNLYFAV